MLNRLTLFAVRSYAKLWKAWRIKTTLNREKKQTTFCKLIFRSNSECFILLYVNCVRILLQYNVVSGDKEKRQYRLWRHHRLCHRCLNSSIFWHPSKNGMQTRRDENQQKCRMKNESCKECLKTASTHHARIDSNWKIKLNNACDEAYMISWISNQPSE